MKCNIIVFAIVTSLFYNSSYSQQTDNILWHGKERTIRYTPEGEDFTIVNGTRRFNRALYGTNSGFRVEAGDLPEFALYMPGMGGNLQFGLIQGDNSKWLINTNYIKARYRPGSMHYEIKDPMLGNGILYLTVLAAADTEGILVKANFENVPNNLKLFWIYGGATGKRFSRDGDIGADPESSFYLKPEYCKDNGYVVQNNSFLLYYGSGKEMTEEELSEIKHIVNQKSETIPPIEKQKIITGIFPPHATIKIADASAQGSPHTLLRSSKSTFPVIIAHAEVKPSEDLHFFIQNPAGGRYNVPYSSIPSLLQQAEEARAKLAQRIKLITPEPYLNTLGGALGVAADGIWEDPTFLHGAVAWRMRLNAWRGAYTADPLGWHDRAKKHFSSYALSQLTTPETGPLAPDTALHFARHTEKIGTAMFSSGYICRNPNGDIRAHHYDMNLVFIDQLLTHFHWTGDVQYIKEMWPLIQRHLAWEKRNFDTDDDGLYDAYCCIWASDGLQYSNGGVTHSSSYNYRANRLAAELATLVGEDSKPYYNESQKIFKAIQSKLWMPDKGWYAEYKDFLGNRSVHPAAGLWTVYHAIDSNVPDPFQAYQTLRYVDTEIPHIPVIVKGFPAGNHYLLSTTNWLPYTWSVNNVALAEVLHTALAYWQGGRPEEGFILWKSALLESMYTSASPGGFQQLSFYDAIRGELYRDFADPIGMVSRTLIEGLFGIKPNALRDTLTIQPGLPLTWNYASLHTPDAKFDFKRSGYKDIYTLSPAFPTKMHLKFKVRASHESIASITVNGKKVRWKVIETSIDYPVIEIQVQKQSSYTIEIVWKGNAIESPTCLTKMAAENKLAIQVKNAAILECYDPQQALEKYEIKKNNISAHIKAHRGNKTVFIKMRQRQMTWWEPLSFSVSEPIEILAGEESDKEMKLILKNNGPPARGNITVNPGKNAYQTSVDLQQNASLEITVPLVHIVTGSNLVRFEWNGKLIEKRLTNWNVKNRTDAKYTTVDLGNYYNDHVTNIFKNKYLSPRPFSPTLQLPWQGIGNWCYPLTEASIDDSGLRALAGEKNEITIPQNIVFSTPGRQEKKNVAFTSKWDNYPDSLLFQLDGQASHIYFLLAGSTNPMQSRFVNGRITIYYDDNTTTELELRNPETWWPIEQDYYTDGFAFKLHAPRPIRVYLKTGLASRNFSDYKTIKGFSNYGIDGGAATILDLPLDPSKKLKHMILKTEANDVVIGLLSATLMN